MSLRIDNREHGVDEGRLFRWKDNSMRYFRLSVMCALLAAIASASIQAAVIVDVQPATFVEGSGVQEVIVRIRTDAADPIQGISLEVGLPDGGAFSFISRNDFLNDNVDPNTLQTVTSGPNYTRLFNESSYFGFGNINKTGSLLEIDQTPDPTIGLLALEFNALNPAPSSFTPLGKLRVDITGLAPGNYGITFRSTTVVGGPGPTPAISGVNGSFSVVAIPEPASIAILSASMGAWMVRRRLRRTSAV